ncbi:hypothetical protein Hdeb2414_s0007g00247941 [Helianthus debilis subsp. tardiflorus]
MIPMPPLLSANTTPPNTTFPTLFHTHNNEAIPSCTQPSRTCREQEREDC